MTKIIRVTQADIDAGVPVKPSLCPVAIAAQRAIPAAKALWVGSWHAGFVLDQRSYDGVLPATTQEHIRDFDAGRGMAPFTTRMTFTSRSK